MGAADSLHLYYADRRDLADALVATLVTAADRERCAALTHPRRRTECLAGRALLRHALERFTGRGGSTHELRATPGGKPECVEGPAISLAHSGEFLVCAVAADDSIGVDVETHKPRPLAMKLAAQYFSPFEASWIEADPDRRFEMLWVIKEAYLKALGVGLAGGLSSLECRIEPPSIEARATGAAAAPSLALFAGHDCYVGVAWLGEPRRAISVVRWVPPGAGDALGSFEPIAATA
jgi:4'-phosphopantetheinyl transferase